MGWASRHALLAFALTLVACGARQGTPQAADSIRVEKAAPPAGARRIETLTAVHGAGCGLLGTMGTYEGAEKRLRAQARAVGADYVQITSVKEPYADRQCVHKEYTLVATAYRVHEPPSAPAVPAPASAVPVPAPARALAPATSAGAGQVSSLEFSARVLGEVGFTVRIDEAPAVAAPSAPGGFELRYDRAARRLALLRMPAGTAVSIAEEPFELDAAWHEWRLTRSADRISAWLDDQPILVHVTPAAGATTFRLEGGEGLELRRIVSETR